MEIMHNDVLTIEELAAYLKIPKSRLYKLRSRRKDPIPEDRPTLAFQEGSH